MRCKSVCTYVFDLTKMGWLERERIFSMLFLGKHPSYCSMKLYYVKVMSYLVFQYTPLHKHLYDASWPVLNVEQQQVQTEITGFLFDSNLLYLKQLNDAISVLVIDFLY